MLTNCRTYAKTVLSDHRLLVARFKLPRYFAMCELHEFKKKAASTQSALYDTDKLKDHETRMAYRASLSSKLKAVMAGEATSGKALWQAVSVSIKEAAAETIGVKKKEKRKVAFADDTLARWSEQQRKIHIDMLSCQSPVTRQRMKSERSRLLKLIRVRVRELRTKALQELVNDVEKHKDDAKTFKALEAVKQFGKAKQKLLVKDDKGDRILDDKEAAEYVRLHFVSQFSDVRKPPLDAHPNGPRPLQREIKPSEVGTAINKLKNRKAVGLDSLSAELVKNGPPELASIIADVFNKAISLGEDLELGLAKLITLQKPGKPAGPVKNIRKSYRQHKQRIGGIDAQMILSGRTGGL